MSNCQIALQFAQRYSLNRIISMYGEYGLYGQIGPYKAKYG